jgi:hypothetical protein
MTSLYDNTYLPFNQLGQKRSTETLRLVLEAAMLVFAIFIPIYVRNNMAEGLTYGWWAHARFYEKTPILFEKDWKDDNLPATVEVIKAQCDNLQHPACMEPIVKTNMIDVRNSLLNNPLPFKYTERYALSIGVPLVVWFGTSLIASIMNQFYQPKLFHNVNAETNDAHNFWRWAPIAYLPMVLVGVLYVVLSNSFVTTDEYNAWENFGAAWTGILFSLLPLVWMIAFQWQTFEKIGLAYWTKGGENVGKENAQKEFYNQKTSESAVAQTRNNFVFYTHLLVAAPSIGYLLCLSQDWLDTHVLWNTIFLLSALFALDGFSAQIAVFWAHLSQNPLVDTSESKNNQTIYYPEQDQHLGYYNYRMDGSMHKAFGIIRLFCWISEAVIILLFFTLRHPISTENLALHQGIFVVVLVGLGFQFLLPDLVREFTDIVSFNAVGSRRWGDFFFRAAATLYFWQMLTRTD